MILSPWSIPILLVQSNDPSPSYQQVQNHCNSPLYSSTFLSARGKPFCSLCLTSKYTSLYNTPLYTIMSLVRCCMWECSGNNQISCCYYILKEQNSLLATIFATRGISFARKSRKKGNAFSFVLHNQPMVEIQWVMG